MAQQKIVIKAQMSSQKCRTKAMKIAAVAYGVSSVGIEGADQDQLVVVGEGVDTANLTLSLKKKLGYATILSVQENNPTPTPAPAPTPAPISTYTNYCHYNQPFPTYYEVVSDPNPSGCSIM